MRLLEITSSLQTIELWDELGAGLVLVLDGMVQFRQSEEHRYHECLTVVPFLFGRPRRVFVGGGGDGLAATRLLRFETVESIVVCDYDPAITDLSRSHPELVALNQGSLDDPRVCVVNADAYAYLRDSDETFDLVICDFPDPFYEPLGRLYSRSFYELVRRRMSGDGLMVTQTLAVPACARMIGATIESVFPHRRFYRFGPHGFTLASEIPLRRAFPVPAWARFLSDEFVDSLFVHSREDAEAFDRAGAERVEEGDSTLVREAVLHVHGPQMAYPFADRPDTWVAEIGPGAVKRLGERAGLLLEALHHNGDLVVLVDEGTAEAERATVARLGYRPTGRQITHAVAPVTADAARLAKSIWSGVNDGQIALLEAMADAPSAHADLVDLIEADHPPALLVEAGARIDPERRAMLLVARSDAGKPLALWRIGHGLDGVGLDWLGGRDHRGRDSFLLVYLYLAELEYMGLTLRAPSAEQILLLTRFGPCRLHTFEVFVRLDEAVSGGTKR